MRLLGERQIVVLLLASQGPGCSKGVVRRRSLV